jgi:hypothetical protein
MDALKCPVCGTESMETVLSDDRNHPGELRQFCRECDQKRHWAEHHGPEFIASGFSRLVTYAGVLLAVLTVTADHLSISGRTGFGWRQLTGAEIGFLCVFLGMLLRRGVLGMFGLFVVALSLGADLLHIGQHPGLGWKKQTALIVATVLLALGLSWQRRLRRSLDSGPHADLGAGMGAAGRGVPGQEEVLTSVQRRS